MTSALELDKILHEQLKKIANATPDELDHEIDRAEAIEILSEQVIKNNALRLDAAKLVAHHNGMKGEAIEPPSL